MALAVLWSELTWRIFIIPDLFPYQDKQEIKTVRIVKRESERRQRDKDKTGGPLISSNVYDRIAELQSSDELNEYLSTTYTSGPRIGSYSEDDALISEDEMCLSSSVTSSNKLSFKPNARVESALKNISIDRNAGSSNIAAPSDRFQSNLTSRIHNKLPVNDSGMMTVGNQQLTDMANNYKRNVPRKKKRHNTAPNSVHSDVFNDYLATRNASKQVNSVLISGIYFSIQLIIFSE